MTSTIGPSECWMIKCGGDQCWMMDCGRDQMLPLIHSPSECWRTECGAETPYTIVDGGFGVGPSLLILLCPLFVLPSDP